MTEKHRKFGARVFSLDTDMVLVYQTVKRGSASNSPYVFDKNPRGSGERFIALGDDKAIADAVRGALAGTL